MNQKLSGKLGAVQSAEGERSVIAYLEIDVTDSDALGGEAVYFGTELVGSISSGSFGPATGKSLAFAFVKPDAAVPGTTLTVSIFGDLCEATVLAQPAFDPDNRRLRIDTGSREAQATSVMSK